SSRRIRRSTTASRGCARTPTASDRLQSRFRDAPSALLNHLDSQLLRLDERDASLHRHRASQMPAVDDLELAEPLPRRELAQRRHDALGHGIRDPLLAPGGLHAQYAALAVV